MHENAEPHPSAFMYKRPPGLEKFHIGQSRVHLAHWHLHGARFPRECRRQLRLVTTALEKLGAQTRSRFFQALWHVCGRSQRFLEIFSLFQSFVSEPDLQDTVFRRLVTERTAQKYFNRCQCDWRRCFPIQRFNPIQRKSLKLKITPVTERHLLCNGYCARLPTQLYTFNLTCLTAFCQQSRT